MFECPRKLIQRVESNPTSGSKSEKAEFAAVQHNQCITNVCHTCMNGQEANGITEMNSRAYPCGGNAGISKLMLIN